AGLMLILSIPFFWMQTFNRGLDELPRGAEVRVATEHEQAIAGRGFGAPVHVLTADVAIAPKLAAIQGVAHVAAPVRSADGSRWLIDATLAVPVESAAARAVVHQIQAAAGGGALIGGSTIFDLDVTNAIFGGLWKMLLVILAACYVVLLLLLRSALLPLQAV